MKLYNFVRCTGNAKGIKIDKEEHINYIRIFMCVFVWVWYKIKVTLYEQIRINR